MACVLTAGLTLPCRTSAGVSTLYLGAWQCGSSTMTIGVTASGAISSFSGATTSFYQICQDLEIAAVTTTGAPVIENGTAYIEITLVFTAFQYSQALNNIYTTLLNGRWRAIVLGNDGNYYFLGYSNPGNVSDTAGGIGKMLNDLNGITFTMTFKEQLGMLQIVGNAQNTIIQSAT